MHFYFLWFCALCIAQETAYNLQQHTDSTGCAGAQYGLLGQLPPPKRSIPLPSTEPI